MSAEDLRCPNGPRALLAKVVQSGDSKKYVDGGQLLELHCRDCTKQLRKEDSDVLRVVHRYNVIGELVQTLVHYKE